MLAPAVLSFKLSFCRYEHKSFVLVSFILCFVLSLTLCCREISSLVLARDDGVAGTCSV